MTQVNDNINSSPGKHLTYEEGVKIVDYKELGYTNHAIAHILNRAPQIINNVNNCGAVRTIQTMSSSER